MRNYLFLFILFSYSFLHSQTQYESLLNKTYAQKADKMHHFFDSILRFNDINKIRSEANKIRTIAIKHNDNSLKYEVDLFELFVSAVFYSKPKNESIKAYKELIDNAGKEGVWHTKLNATRALAEYYWKFMNNYELSFEQYLLLDNELSKINSEDYPQKARDYTQIGESFYFFRDYQQARKFLKKAIEITETEFNTKIITAAKNTIGLSYQKEGQYDSAYYYFQLALQPKFESSKTQWQRIVRGNIGANYYYLGQYEKAIPLLEEDYKGSVKDNDIGCLVGSSTLLAEYFLKKKDNKTSWFYVQEAYSHALKMKSVERLMHIYPILSNWYSENGNAHYSKLYLDSTITALNEYQEKFNALKILRAQQEITNHKEKLTKANFELERQKSINKLNFSLTASILLVIVIIVGFLYQKRKRKRIEFEKKAIEKNLVYANSEIKQFIKKNNEQNLLIEKIQSEFEKIKDFKDDEKNRLETTLFELRSATILTDSDWTWFKQHFTTIFPDFLSVLKKKQPDITDAEMRYLMLAKLDLSHKDMANMLGISPDSVRVTWNRVRKKLGGTTDDSPISLIKKYE